MNGIWDFITSAIKPITDMVDSLTTSDEERLELKNKLVELQNQMTMKVLEYQQKLNEIQGKVIIAEAQGESWLQRNWRPLMAFAFIFIIVNNYIFVPYFQLFGLPNVSIAIPDGMWDLLKIMIGGYVVGRSGEKIARHLKENKNGG